MTSEYKILWRENGEACEDEARDKRTAVYAYLSTANMWGCYITELHVLRDGVDITDEIEQFLKD